MREADWARASQIMENLDAMVEWLRQPRAASSNQRRRGAILAFPPGAGRAPGAAALVNAAAEQLATFGHEIETGAAAGRWSRGTLQRIETEYQRLLERFEQYRVFVSGGSDDLATPIVGFVEHDHFLRGFAAQQEAFKAQQEAFRAQFDDLSP